MKIPTIPFQYRIVLLYLLSSANSLFAMCSPEMDPGSAAGGIVLLAGSFAVIFGRRKRQEKP